MSAESSVPPGASPPSRSSLDMLDEGVRAPAPDVPADLAEAAGLCLWRLDAKTRRIVASPGLYAMLGYDEPPADRTLSALEGHIDTEDLATLRAARDEALRGGELHLELRVCRRDGRVAWIGLHGRGVDGGSIEGVAHDVTDRKLAAASSPDRTLLQAATEALRREQQRVRELLARHVQAIEDERSRISRELHDTLGQHLAALGLGLRMIDDLPGRSAAAGQRLQQLRTVLDRLENEVDRLSFELRPPALDELGLEDALRSYAQQWSTDVGIAIELHTHGLRPGRLPPLVETTLYRVLQEALTNVGKHADATRVGVIVERRLDELRMVIEDDGRGFDPSRAGPDGGRHWGLRGMAERAMLVAGQFQVEASPGNGTTLYLCVPLRPEGLAGEQGV